MEEQKVEYAGFWVRALAAIIDSILIILITFPILVYIYGWEYFDFEQTGWVAGPAEIVISWILPSIATIIFWLTKQATPGKMAVGVKVVDAITGNTMSVGQAVGRNLAYVASLFPCGLGFIWIAFDVKKQGWHDKLAGTVAVNVQRSNL